MLAATAFAHLGAGIAAQVTVTEFHRRVLRNLLHHTELAADCAADGVYEFQLVAPPLSVTGGVGSPVNPIAIK